MNAKKISMFMLAGTVLSLTVFAAFKGIQQIYPIEETIVSHIKKDSFKLTNEILERFYKLADAAKNDSHFMGGLRELEIDEEDIRFEHIIGADDDFVTLLLPAGYTIRLGESNVNVRWMIYREAYNEKTAQ